MVSHYIDIAQNRLVHCVFPWSILCRITDGNNLLCVYDCMFNQTVSFQTDRFLAYFLPSYIIYILSKHLTYLSNFVLCRKLPEWY